MAEAQILTFALALAAFMSAEAELSDVSGLRPLFVNQLNETSSTLLASPPSPASVVHVYAGTIDYLPIVQASVQCKTIAIAGNDSGGFTRAGDLHSTLVDAAGIPLRGVPIDGFLIQGVLGLQVPTMVSRDDKGRAEIVFNFDCQFIAGDYTASEQS